MKKFKVDPKFYVYEVYKYAMQETDNNWKKYYLLMIQMGQLQTLKNALLILIILKLFSDI